MSKFEAKVEEGKLVASLDMNEDGEKLLQVKLSMGEAIEEAFKKGQKLEGVKLVSFGFEGKALVMKVDSDQDGQEVLELKVDLGEALDEVGLFK